MLRPFLLLALVATLGPTAVSAQTPPAPAVPAPASPAAPAPTPPARAPRVGGRITAIDAAAKTVTLTRGKKTVTLSVPDGTKIYKVGDAKGQPTGTFADLTVGTPVSATTDGGATAPVAKTVHLRMPRGGAAPAPAAPVAPATP